MLVSDKRGSSLLHEGACSSILTFMMRGCPSVTGSTRYQLLRHRPRHASLTVQQTENLSLRADVLSLHPLGVTYNALEKSDGREIRTHACKAQRFPCPIGRRIKNDAPVEFKTVLLTTRAGHLFVCYLALLACCGLWARGAGDETREGRRRGNESTALALLLAKDPFNVNQASVAFPT